MDNLITQVQHQRTKNSIRISVYYIGFSLAFMLLAPFGVNHELSVSTHRLLITHGLVLAVVNIIVIPFGSDADKYLAEITLHNIIVFLVSFANQAYFGFTLPSFFGALSECISRGNFDSFLQLNSQINFGAMFGFGFWYSVAIISELCIVTQIFQLGYSISNQDYIAYHSFGFLGAMIWNFITFPFRIFSRKQTKTTHKD